jgi:hypothetical protein
MGTKLYPENAQWISVKTTTFLPHSNECGLHVILALIIMGLHQHPQESMLIPLMHKNIVMILRTWVAKIVIMNTFDTHLFQQYIQSQNHPAYHGRRSLSTPHNLFHIMHSSSSSGTHSRPINTQTPEPMASNHKMEPIPPSEDNTASPLADPPIPTQRLKNSTLHPKSVSRTVLPYTNEPQIKTDEYNPASQTKIHQWTVNRMAPKVTNSSLEWDPDVHSFGTPPQTIDPTVTLRIIAQNPQHSLQASYENEAFIQTLVNLQDLQTSIYSAISPNINFCNPSHTTSFKNQFRRVFKQAHVSAASCEIGLQPTYKNRYNLTGGVAVVTTSHWTSKICGTQHDTHGYGTYTITSLQGRNGKKLSIIAAYISVE